MVIGLEVTREELKEVDAIKEMAGYATRKELFISASRRFREIIEAIREGKSVVVIGPDDKTEKVIAAPGCW